MFYFLRRSQGDYYYIVAGNELIRMDLAKCP